MSVKEGQARWASLQRVTPRMIRTHVRNLYWEYRKATSRNRVLPDFIIVGAQKSGTTSLWSYLIQHPHIIPSYPERVHFFDGGLNPAIDHFTLGEEWYRAHFPLKKRLGGHDKTFEWAPLYFYNPLAPSRMAEIIPNAKLIFLLRNPTERAISNYFHERRSGREPMPLDKALRAEDKRLESTMLSHNYKNETFIYFSYKHRGLYYQQLTRYLQYYSWEQMCVLSSEEFFNEPERNLRMIFDFVGVDDQFKIKDLRPKNVGYNRAPIDPYIRAQLDEYFRPSNRALYKLVGRDFGW
jgi:hypothetical protein